MQLLWEKITRTSDNEIIMIYIPRRTAVQGTDFRNDAFDMLLEIKFGDDKELSIIVSVGLSDLTDRAAWSFITELALKLYLSIRQLF